MTKIKEHNKLNLSCIYNKLVLKSEGLKLSINDELEENEKLNLKNKIWWIDNRATWVAHCIALCGDVPVDDAVTKMNSNPFLSHKICCAENPWLRGIEFLQNDLCQYYNMQFVISLFNVAEVFTYFNSLPPFHTLPL